MLCNGVGASRKDAHRRRAQVAWRCAQVARLGMQIVSRTAELAIFDCSVLLFALFFVKSYLRLTEKIEERSRESLSNSWYVGL